MQYQNNTFIRKNSRESNEGELDKHMHAMLPRQRIVLDLTFGESGAL